MPLIEIHGDVWLLSEVIGIHLNEPEPDEKWEVEILIRGYPFDSEAAVYFFDSKREAEAEHIRLVSAWKTWLTT